MIWLPNKLLWSYDILQKRKPNKNIKNQHYIRNIEKIDKGLIPTKMAQINIGGNNRLIKITLILIFSYLAVVLITTYPTVDDFIFLNISNAVRAESIGYFDAISDRVPGFTAVIIILNEVCNIPYEELLTLPLLLIPFVLVFLAILKRSGEYVYPLIAVVCLLYFCKHRCCFAIQLVCLCYLWLFFLQYSHGKH